MNEIAQLNGSQEHKRAVSNRMTEQTRRRVSSTLSSS
jgi:hypothetical protein